MRRIVLKLSGESLLGEERSGIELDSLFRMAKEIRSGLDRNVQLGIVIGGGNIFRGLAASAKGMDRANADYKRCWD